MPKRIVPDNTLQYSNHYDGISKPNLSENNKNLSLEVRKSRRIFLNSYSDENYELENWIYFVLILISVAILSIPFCLILKYSYDRSR